MEKEKLILITNDDGFDAEGIKEITNGLKDLGKLIIVAPDRPRSGMSSAITSSLPIQVTQLQKSENLTIYSCNGTPTDCVKIAINEVLDRKPDLLVSGINHGGNHAICVHYSGTMGAAIEGCIFDVPSIGISLYNYSEDSSFDESVRLGRMVCNTILSNGLPRGTYLNLNVPNIREVHGIAVCRQADGRWINEYSRTLNDDGSPLFWLGGEFMEYQPIYPDNDTQRLKEGYASLVPCMIDVTNYSYMHTLKNWFALK